MIKSKNLVLFSSLLFASTNTASKGLIKSDVSTLNFSAGLSATSVQETFVNAKLVSFKLRLKGSHQLYEALDASFEVGANLESGSNNAQFINEFEPSKNWTLKEAKVSWQPISFFNVQLGALNQKHLNNPLLVGGNAFASAKQKVSIPFTPDHEIYFESEQAIPNNQSLSERIGQTNQGNPQFMHHRLGAKLDGNVLSIKGSVGKWNYTGLSSGVAFRSLFLGNSTNGGDSSTSKFIYGYSGISAYSEVSSQLSDMLSLNLEGQYLYNDKAPEGRNKGNRLKFGLGIYGHEIFGEFFRNESDSSVAFYNAGLYGHNNKEGVAAGISGKLKTSKLSYLFRMSEMKKIKSSLYQNDTTRFDLSLTKNF
ncbi:hypothetical protein OAT67_02685 [Bacteriovoracaceae bacterium]|nr:hypothetical protein [Bacteriovoracaceae bacterium]